MAWTTTELLASIKRRASMPSAAATFSDAELLTMATEQLHEYVVPLVLNVREDYWTKTNDQALVDGTATYRLPYRAVMGKLREVTVLDADENPRNVPRLNVNDLDAAEWGFYLLGDQVTLVTRLADQETSLGETLRLHYHLRPSPLVATTASTTVASFNAGAKTVTLASAPTGYSTATSWDIIRAKPPFDSLTYDAGGTINSTTITFTNALPADLAAGDHVCLPEQSPVPQIPVELHGLLAQKTAIKVLEAKGMTDKLSTAREELVRLENDARQVLSPRVDGESLRVFNRRSLYRNPW